MKTIVFLGLNAMPPTLGKNDVASNSIVSLSATRLFFIHNRQTFLICLKHKVMAKLCYMYFPYIYV